MLAYKRVKSEVIKNTPDAIRTHDLLLRRQLLYPAELPGHKLYSIFIYRRIEQQLLYLPKAVAFLAAELPGHKLYSIFIYRRIEQQLLYLPKAVAFLAAELSLAYIIFTTHKPFLQVFYNPNMARSLNTPTCTILSTIKARIGERSSIPKGGIIFLKGAKKSSVKSFKNRKGCVYQLIFGIQVKKILTSISSIIRSKSRYIAIDMPILPVRIKTLSLLLCCYICKLCFHRCLQLFHIKAFQGF